MGAIQRCIATVSLTIMLVVGSAQSLALAQDSPEAVVQDLDVAAYPTVAMKVSLPSFFPEDGVEFAVEENGQAVEGVNASLLSSSDSPPRVVLVIDTSGSMKGEPLEDARFAARRFSQTIGEDALISVITFNDSATTIGAFGAEKDQVLSKLSLLTAAGETALYDAVVAATKQLSAPWPGQSAIVVLSDGGDDSSKASFEAAVAALRATGAPLYAVALESDDFNPRPLQTLAEESGGRLIPAGQSAQLTTLFENIATEISRTYLVRYTSLEPSTKDVELDVVAISGEERVSAAVHYPNPRATIADPTAADLVVPKVGSNTALFAAATILAFGAVALLVLGLLMIVVKEPTALRQLRYYDQLHTSGERSGGLATDQVREKIVGAVATVAGKRGLTQVIADKLVRAGLPLRPTEYMTAHLLTVVGLGVFVQLLVGSYPLSFMVVVFASIAPVLLLDIAVSRRRSKFEEQLPDVLSMVAVSLRGGWGLLQAVDFVVEQASSPASDEFRRVQTEVRLGMPLEQSLHGMAERLDSRDFDAAVTAMAIQREVGGNLAEILDTVGKTVRERAALRRQVSALTAEGRLSAIILMLLPFLEAAALILISPGYLAPLYSTPFGILLALGAVVLLVVGGFWLRGVTRIEV